MEMERPELINHSRRMYERINGIGTCNVVWVQMNSMNEHMFLECEGYVNEREVLGKVRICVLQRDKGAFGGGEG